MKQFLLVRQTDSYMKLMCQMRLLYRCQDLGPDSVCSFESLATHMVNCLNNLD